LYQKESIPPLAGTRKVCEIELSPFVALVEPSMAAKFPEWPGLVTVALPVLVHPLRLPVSNPPFTMLLDVAVTVTVTAVLCVAEPSTPVTVTV